MGQQSLGGKATTPGKKGGDVFDQSAAGLTNAGKATLAAGQGYAGIANDPRGGLGANSAGTYNPAMVQGNFGYDPTAMGAANYSAANMTPAQAQAAMRGSTSYTAQNMQGTGYNALNRGSTDYNAANMNAAQAQAFNRGSTDYAAAMQGGPDAIAKGMSAYMNPYTNDVIKNSQRDIQQQTALGLRGLGDQAAGMGAFGGSRQGIAEGTAIAEGTRALGDISSQMRQQGFDTAAQLSGQDVSNRMSVNAANQAALNAQRQYGAGSREAMMAANQAAQNANSQFNAGNLQAANAANQAAINAQRQYGAGSREAMMAANQAAGNEARQFGAANQQQANAANQAAQNAARIYGANSREAMLAANQAATNANNQFNAGNRQAANANNQAAINAQRQFGAGNQQASMANNQAAWNAADQYNAGMDWNVANANAAARNAAGQFNAGAQTTQNNNAVNNRLAALAGMGTMGAQGANLAGQGMGIGQGLAGQQAQNGAQIQNMNQQLMGQSAGMFDQYVGQPMDSVAGILNLLSGNPLSGTGKTTQVNTPGVKSQLSGALGLAGRVAGA